MATPLSTALDLTQVALARRVPCSTSLIRKYESGERRPPRQTVERLADILEIDTDQRPAFLRAALGGSVEADTAHDLSPTQSPQSKGHLPIPPTPLIGRERDLRDVCQLLNTTLGRLVTLLGPPGVGKTRLGIQVASTMRLAFPDGAWFIALAALRDPAQVETTIAHRLGIREQPGRTMQEVLTAQLCNQHLLLVLDNFEHILAASSLVAELLSCCPQLVVLATSRIPLQLRAEQRFPVAPLALPSPTERTRLKTIARAPATALFLERTRSITPTFTLTTANAGLIAAICARLDGLPLAIELAAARMDSLSCAALHAQLDRCLPVLVTGPHDLPARHQTLRDTLAWSYTLLATEEQHCFAFLGVFVGGWTREAAETVGAGAHLDTLVRASLVQSTAASMGEPRYLLLATLHEYALEHLEAHPEAAACRSRHASYFAQLAERTEPELRSTQDTLWLPRIDRDLENFRAAMSWSLANDGGVIAARITVALHLFWQTRGLWRDAYRIAPLLEANEHILSPALRLAACYTAGYALSQHTSMDNARQAFALFTRARVLAYELNDVRGAVRALTMLAMMARYPGNHTYVRGLLDEAIRLTEAGSRAVQITLYLQMGQLLQEAGDNAGATDAFGRAVQLARAERRSILLGNALPALAETLLRQGNEASARRICIEALDLISTHTIRDAMADTYYVQGMLAARAGARAEARASYETALAGFCELGMLFGAARVECSLGHLALLDGDLASAAERFQAALQTAYEIFLIEVMSYSLGGLAAVAAAQGDDEQAVRLLGAAEAVHARFALRTDPDDAAARALARTSAEARLGSLHFDAIYETVVRAVHERLPRIAFDTSYEAFVTLALPTVIGEALASVPDIYERDLDERAR